VWLMAYSQAFSQAVTIVVYIAVKMNYENSSQYFATKYISDKLNIPIPTANKVIKSLVISGIIVSKEGARGGLMLARNPEDITLLDIFLAMEHERPLFKPVNEPNVYGEEVEFYRNNINNSLIESENAMKEKLSKITIKKLIE
jgi:Rrf2 family protein